MATSKKFRMGRLSMEFLVVVIGVLVALAVDRWAAGIERQENVEAYLVALRADFVANRKSALNRTSAESTLAELATRFLEVLESGESTDPPEFVVLAAELSGYTVYESYASGAWDNAQLSAADRVATDATLQIAISDFYRRQEWTARLDAEFFQYIQEYRLAVRPLVPARVRLEMNRAFPGWDRGEVTTGPIEYLRSIDITGTAAALAATPDLAGLLADVIMSRRVAASIAEDDVDRIDQIMLMIDEELLDLR